MTKKVSVVIYEGCWATGIFSVVDFFRIVALLEKQLGLPPRYKVRLLSVNGMPIQAAGGHLIHPDGSLHDETNAQLLVIPAIEGTYLNDQFIPEPGIIAWLQAGRSRGAHVLALTTGACFLAAAGLATQCLVTTHWAYMRWLTQRYPNVQFVANRTFLQSEGIWSTGSLDGSFDALLTMLAQECGDHFAQWCATYLLISDPSRMNPILPTYRNHCDEKILRVEEWIESRYAQAITIEQMGEEVGLAPRTLKRRFQQALQLSPNLYVQKVRIDKAKKLLLTTTMAVNEIAYSVGYANTSFFIRLFKLHTSQTPAQWRKIGMMAQT